MESIDPYFFIRRVLIFMVDIFIRIKYNFPRVLHLIKRRRIGQKKNMKGRMEKKEIWILIKASNSDAAIRIQEVPG